MIKKLLRDKYPGVPLIAWGEFGAMKKHANLGGSDVSHADVHAGNTKKAGEQGKDYHHGVVSTNKAVTVPVSDLNI